MNIKQVLEFRGYTERITKNNNKQFCLNFEGENGESSQLHTNNEQLVKTLAKGTKYVVAYSLPNDAYLFVNGIAPVK